MRPLYVYDNWSAYDELSDSVPLTEELAVAQFREVVRLRSMGVRLDAYLMDAFWYEPSGGYREWRGDRWPEGPDGWLSACAAEGILAGLWFPANTAFHIEPLDSWKDSLAADGWGFCCFEGGFMEGFVSVLEYWYGCGVRVFKFDFADFGAVPERVRLSMLPSEIRARNVSAYRGALFGFRARCPEAVLLAYNGFEEAEYMTCTDRPIRRVMDPAWLDLFRTVYAGDPRPADLPLLDFWRTLDVYADHMVRYLHDGGLRLEQIDNCAFMIGTTGTCYRRGAAGWRTTLLLSLARGGQVHMTLGNLEQLSDEDGAWFARVQQFYESAGQPELFGGIPGKGEVYGYRAGDVITIVNPSLATETFDIEAGAIAYRDGLVEQDGGKIVLGPGAVGVFCENSVDLGFFGEGFELLPRGGVLGTNWVEREFEGNSGDLLFVVRMYDSKGLGVRVTGGAPPDGRSNGEMLLISVTQDGRALAVGRPDDLVLWSGISWGTAVVLKDEIGPGPLRVRAETSDPRVARMTLDCYEFSEARRFPL